MAVVALVVLAIGACAGHGAAGGAAAGPDPDANRTFRQIVEAKGFPCEEHNVTTADGYVLTLFRIPGAPSSPTPAPGRTRRRTSGRGGDSCSAQPWSEGARL